MGAIRNVLLVTLDQWRWDALSAMGHPVLKTPVFDALAADGTLFANHWSVTCPCGPGRASLFTGTYLHRHRSLRNGTPLDRRFTNLALEARALGHDPVLFGYTDISADPRGLAPDDPALESYEGVLPGMRRVCRLDDDFSSWFTDLTAKGYALPADKWDIFRPDPAAVARADRPYSHAPAPVRAEDSNTAFLTDRLLDYLGERGEEPWFAHISYISPHPPFIAPAPYNDRYDPAALPTPRRAGSPTAEGAAHPYLDFRINRSDTGSSGGHGLTIGHAVRPSEMTDAETMQLRATYLGMVNEVEANVARILDHLRATGAYDETLIVVTSDHGEQLGDHWMFSKHGFFDESYRIPLIVRDPRPAADPGRGRRVAAFTESVDVAPTILAALAGASAVPRQMDGAPLSAWLEGRTPAHWRDAALVGYDFGDPVGREAERHFGLRTDQCGLQMLTDGRYKYVHFQALPPLLYDLTRDPDQLENRAGDPAYAEELAAMAGRLLSRRMESEERDLTHLHIENGAAAHDDGRYEGML